jgi:hypothetical protein
MLRITRHGLEKARTPKRWRSKEAKEIVAAVQQRVDRWSAPPAGI